MSSLLILITAIVFYYIGKYSSNTHEKEAVEGVLRKFGGKVKKIPYLTKEERKIKGTDQEKIEKLMSDTLRRLSETK